MPETTAPMTLYTITAGHNDTVILPPSAIFGGVVYDPGTKRVMFPYLAGSGVQRAAYRVHYAFEGEVFHPGVVLVGSAPWTAEGVGVFGCTVVLIPA